MNVDLALQDGPVDEYTRRQLLRQHLDDLAAVGDLAELGRGQWISTTGSIVAVDSTAGPSHRLVSGIPVRNFPSAVQRALALVGHTRVVERTDDLRALGLPVIDLDDWARIPNLPLDQWTSSVLSGPLGDPDESAGAIHIYQPDSARPKARQDDRWSPPHRNLQGRCLARRNMVGGWTEYAVVEMSSGAVIARRELDPLDVRRLMYGLDHRSGTSVSADVKTTRGSTQIFLVDSLPHPETRALLALCGLPVRNTWTVQQHIDIDIALRYLSNLYIDIRPENRPPPGRTGNQ